MRKRNCLLFPERRCLLRIAVPVHPRFSPDLHFATKALLTLRFLLVDQVVNHTRPARRG